MTLEAAEKADEIWQGRVSSSNGQHAVPREDAEAPLPHSTPLELGVVAAALVHPGLAGELGPDTPNLFFDPELARALSHVQAMASDGKPVDLNLLRAQADAAGENVTDMIGHLTSAIFAGTPTPSMARQYVDQLRELAARREAVLLGFDLQKSGRSLGAAELLEMAEKGRERVGRIVEGTTGYFDVLTSHELATGDHALDYLIDGVLVRGQPCLLAGMYKALKTSIGIDLAIALATRGMFLGYFHVLVQARVLFMSAESGLATILETAERICRAANVRLDDIEGLFWSTNLPKPHVSDDMAALRALLKRDRIEVLVLDPAYLLLPADDVANLFKQGEVLGKLSGLCQELGVTLILVHHAKKSLSTHYEPMELADAAFSGFAEFSRQWLLLSRREKYEPGSGNHRLYLSVGGSAGHSGLWGLDIDEGIGHDHRHWNVDLLDVRDIRAGQEERKLGAKDARDQAQAEALLKRLVGLLLKTPEGETTRKLRELVGAGDTALNRAIAMGVDQGHIEPCEVFKACRKTPYEGYKLTQRAISDVA